MPHLGHFSSVHAGWSACVREFLVKAVAYASAKAMGLICLCCIRVKEGRLKFPQPGI